MTDPDESSADELNRDRDDSPAAADRAEPGATDSTSTDTPSAGPAAAGGEVGGESGGEVSAETADASRNPFDGMGEIVDEDLDELGDDQVEQAWQTFRTKFLGRRGLVLGSTFIVLILILIYGVLPQIPGLEASIEELRHNGDRKWLFAAFLLKAVSYLAYIGFFRTIFNGEAPRVGWRGSYHISMAGIAATRMIGAAGAGGIALTFWAVRKAGMGRRLSVSYMVAFYVILYGIFMMSLLLGGLLLRIGVLPGANPFGLTVVPAIFGGLVILLFLTALLIPTNVERLAARWAAGRGKMAAIGSRLAAIPALIGNGTRIALQYTRRLDPWLLGALGWWVFDLATLWACFEAFGYNPPFGVLLMGYLFGWVANVIPTPGGVGAVDGGMIGAFLVFGVQADVAVAAVLGYRIFAFFLPTIPGVISFFRLRTLTNEWQGEAATIQSEVTSPGAV